MSLQQNERAKLSATYLNGVAIAVLAVGGLAPLAADFTRQAAVVSGQTELLVGGCVLVSGSLHVVARSILNLLRE